MTSEKTPSNQPPEETPLDISVLYQRWRQELFYGEFEEAVLIGKKLLELGETPEALAQFRDQVLQNIPADVLDEAEGITIDAVREGVQYKVDVVLVIPPEPSNLLEPVLLRKYIPKTELERQFSSFRVFIDLVSRFPEFALQRYTENLGTEYEITTAKIEQAMKRVDEVSPKYFEFFETTPEQALDDLRLLIKSLQQIEKGSNN